MTEQPRNPFLPPGTQPVLAPVPAPVPAAEQARPTRRYLPNWVLLIALVPLLAIPGAILGSAYVDVGQPMPPVLDTSKEYVAASEAEAIKAAAVPPGPGKALLDALNDTLMAKDRDGFFSHVSGDAVAPLTLFWDNMDRIGWNGGAFGVEGSQIDDVESGSQFQVVMGASMAFTATVPRGAGTADAGKTMVQGFDYDASTCAAPDGTLTLCAFDHYMTVKPWDLGELYVAKAEHVTLAGRPEDATAIDAVLPRAESGAKWALDQYTGAGQTPSVNGFLAFYTPDDATFNQWFEGPVTSLGFEPAGVAIPTVRPYEGSVGLDPMMATGGMTSTSVVKVGRGAYSYDDPATVFAHEFIHVLHYDAAPTDYDDWSSFSGDTGATIEGWARFEDLIQRHPGANLPSRSTWDGAFIADCVATSFTGAPPTEAQLQSTDDSQCAYMLSATIYGYARDAGYDLFDLSKAAKLANTDPISVTAKQDFGLPPLTLDGWSQWVHSRY